MYALIVDDSRSMRSIIGRILKQLGFGILEAEHGMDALERLDSSPLPQLVMVDWNMPVMNGLQFVQAVRTQERWAGLTIVMVTTESDVSRVESALNAGANEYVMKPFTPDVLREKLSMLGIATAEVSS